MKIVLFNKLIVIRKPIIVYSMPTQIVYGITNKTRDTKFVLFLDYDCVDYDIVVEDIKLLQNTYRDIGTLIVLKTREKINNLVNKVIGSYHVVGFTKYNFSEIKKIINMTRCDEHYKVGYKYQSRCWVLRISAKYNLDNGKEERKKPELKQIFYKKTNREANSGLIKLFENLYNIKIRNYFSNLDKDYHVEFIRYVTKK